MTAPHLRPMALVLAAFVAAPPLLTAQSSLDASLRRPVAPAAEALLVAHGQDARVVERWRGAIAHGSPEVRAVVARVIQMAGAVTLAADVDQQLASERDARAAAEQAATVTAITGRVSDHARAAAARVGPVVAAAVAQALARVAPSILLSELATLRAHGADVDIALVDILQRWYRAAPGQAARLQLALVRAGDAHAWRVVLKAMDRAGLTLDGGPLTTALGSRHAEVVALAQAYLLQMPDAAFTSTLAAPGVRAAVDGVTAAQSDRSFRLGQALIGHRLGTPLPERWLEDAAAVPETSVLRRLTPANFAGLPEDVRSALARAWNMPPEKKREKTGKDAGPARSGAAFISDLPSPLLHSVLRETRCQSRYAAATVRVRYGLDGRPGTIVVSDETKAACREVVAALVSLSPGLPGDELSIIVPLDPDVPAGFGARPAVQARYLPTDWNAPHPADVGAKLVKFVEPTFGAVSLRHKLEDEVVFDIIVDEAGSVAALQFRRSGHPELNTTAARSIMQMQFTPSTLNGKAVPTCGTFTYTFGW